MQAFEPQKIKITSGTKEWADYNVNCIKGCYNDCRYCYARVMARRFNRIVDNNWAKMLLNDNVVDKKFSTRSGRIMFPSTHDLFDFNPYKDVCLRILENLLIAKNDILITTKPRIKVIHEIVDRFDRYKSQIQFRFTITSNNDQLLEFWEPNAPRFSERIQSLEFAFNHGYKTSVSIEPFLDYDPLPLINGIQGFVTESIWLGKMNYITKEGLSPKEQEFYSNVRKNYEIAHLQAIVKEVSKNPKIRLKDSIKNRMSCGKHAP